MVTTVLQLPDHLTNYVDTMHISRWTVMAILFVVYIILGMFLEVVSILLITLPVVYPLITSLGFNGLWFGIVLVILMEFRSEENTSELQSLMRISYAVFCLK